MSPASTSPSQAKRVSRDGPVVRALDSNTSFFTRRPSASYAYRTREPFGSFTSRSRSRTSHRYSVDARHATQRVALPLTLHENCGQIRPRNRRAHTLLDSTTARIVGGLDNEGP